MHQLPDDVVRNGQRDRGSLRIHGLKEDREHRGHGGRLTNVHVGIEVQQPVMQLGKEVHTRLALGHGVRRAIQCGQVRGQWLELFRVRHEAGHLLFAAHGAKARQYAFKAGRHHLSLRHALKILPLSILLPLCIW